MPEVYGLFSLFDTCADHLQQLPKPIDQFSVMIHHQFGLILSHNKLNAHWHVIVLGLGKGALIAIVIGSCIEHQVEGTSCQKRNLIVDGLEHRKPRQSGRALPVLGKRSPLRTGASFGGRLA